MPKGYHNVDPATLHTFTSREVEAGLTPGDRVRFLEKIDRTAGCWLWTSNLSGGKPGMRYGMFGVTRGGKQFSLYAHRIAWILAHGPIPDGIQIRHACDEPRCVNVKHLLLGTHGDNMRDAAERGRLHVPRPSNHKLTTDQLPEIDALLASGVTQAEIGRRYGVSKTWVSLYARGNRRQYDRPRTLRRSA